MVARTLLLALAAPAAVAAQTTAAPAWSAAVPAGAQTAVSDAVSSGMRPVPMMSPPTTVAAWAAPTQPYVPPTTQAPTTLPPVAVTVPPTSAPDETLGCFHYGYAYKTFIPNASTLQNSSYGCQLACRAYGSECKGFTWWMPGGPAQYECDLAIKGHSVFLAPTTAQSGSAISGPQYCPSVPDACDGHPAGPGFPGATPEASAAAFDGGHIPTNAQCWPRDATGFPRPCQMQTVTVLEDHATGWPGKCMDLTRIYPPAGQNCQTTCQQNVLCSVWQQMNVSGDVQCWQGGFGKMCYSRPGFAPEASQRIMHGSYRVIKDLKGIEVMGLTSVFSTSLFKNESTAIQKCRNYCIANLACQYWLYSQASGCWVENPKYNRVHYPLYLDPKVANVGTDLANAVVAGEFIQHYCGGEEFRVTTQAPLPAQGASFGLGGDFSLSRQQAPVSAAVPSMSVAPPEPAAVSTELIMPATAGATKIEVKSTVGFKVGDSIKVGDEDNEVVGFGSIYLKTPLKENHGAGTVVVVTKDDGSGGMATWMKILLGLVGLLLCGALAGFAFFYYKKQARGRKRGPRAAAVAAADFDIPENGVNTGASMIEEAPLLEPTNYQQPPTPQSQQRAAVSAFGQPPSLKQYYAHTQQRPAPTTQAFPQPAFPQPFPQPQPAYQMPGYRGAY